MLRRSLSLVLAVITGLCLVSCATTIDPVERLAGLYEDGDGTKGYTDTFLDEEIEDPIVFGLEAIEDLRSSFPLDARGRARAVTVLSTTSREDPSPALRTAATWLLRDVFEGPAVWAPKEAEVSPPPLEEVEGALRIIREFGDKLVGEVSLTEEERSRDRAARDLLNGLRVEGKGARVATRNILASLIFEGDRRALDEDTWAFFEEARGLCEHLGFLAFSDSLEDDDAEVRAGGACGLLRLDPSSHYDAVLQAFFPLDDASPLISLEDIADDAFTSLQRVSILKELARAPIDLESLSPEIRRIWAGILRSRRAAVAHWGKQAVIGLVGAGDTADPEELIRRLGVQDEILEEGPGG